MSPQASSLEVAPSESAIRQRLCMHLSAGPDVQTVNEFWIPRANQRVDVVALASEVQGFEIKSARDTLRRLPNQVTAFGTVLDRCTAVVADCHLAAVQQLVPTWWGIMVAGRNKDHVVLEPVRDAGWNESVDPQAVVRLLWRDEAHDILERLGCAPAPNASRGSMWQKLLLVLLPDDLRECVRLALRARKQRDDLRWQSRLTGGIGVPAELVNNKSNVVR